MQAAAAAAVSSSSSVQQQQQHVGKEMPISRVVIAVLNTTVVLLD
jgi:hypothetical protein